MDHLSALEHGLAPTAALLDQAFADYFVKLPASAATLAAMVRQDSVDLSLSRVWFTGGQPAGVLLHAQRGWDARLAAMGIVPAARRQGLGRRMVRTWIEDCRRSGLRRLLLEVIGANVAARRLYESCGFAPIQRLAGWTASAEIIAEATTATPAPIDLRTLARMIALQDDDGALPWQIAAESVAQLGPPWTGWQWRDAAVAVSNLDAPTITVRGLAWSPATGPAPAAELLRALRMRHPDREWRTPAIFPESWAPLFTAAGWRANALDQWQMALPLS